MKKFRISALVAFFLFCSAIPGHATNGTGSPSGVRGITALTGDVSATGPGSVAATVNAIGGQTISLGSSFATSGANSLTLTTTGVTNVTLPTTGTLATVGGTASSFSGGTTGLTPASPTTGAIVLGGVVNVANGGTASSTGDLSALSSMSLNGLYLSTFGVRFSQGLSAVADCNIATGSSSDQSTLLQACEAKALSANIPMILPSGTVFGNIIVTGDHFTLDCENGSYGGCTLEMPASKNTAVIQTQNFSTLVGGSTLGTGYFTLRNVTLNGNMANNTSGDCLDYYGYTPNWDNVSLAQCPERMIYPDWGSSAGPVYGMEGHVSHIRGDTSGKECVLFGGPHDTQWDDIIMIDCARSGTPGTYSGFKLLNGRGNIHMANAHIWQRTPGADYTLNDDSNGFNNAFLGSWFEDGSVGSGRITSNNSLFSGGTRFTQTGSTTTGPVVLILGSADTFDGAVAANNTAGQYGYQIGDSTHTPINTVISGEVTYTPAGAVNFFADGGASVINISGFVVGSYPFVSGTIPFGSDSVKILSGSSYFSKESSITNTNGTVAYGDSYSGLLTDGAVSGFATAYFNAGSATVAITQGSNTALGAGLFALKSRNFAGGTTAVQSGDNLFTIHAQGADGTTQGVASSSIAFDADGAVSTAGVPGRIRFLTSPLGTNIPVEAMRINDVQQVGIGTTVPTTALTVIGTASATAFAGAGTGLTGTASSLTAGNVTTNANLTGPITSSGNATSIASQTGTGTTFAMSASPTFSGTVNGVAEVMSGAAQAATVSVGTATATNALDVYGDASIGTSFAATAAPANGLIVAGSAGIGTASPLVPLQVNTPGAAGAVQMGSLTGALGLGAITLNGQGLTTSTYNFASGAGGNLLISRQSGTSMILNESNSAQVTIITGGSVGIGTGSPLAKLDVRGPIKMNGYIVSTLPTGSVGDIAYVTDQLTTCAVTGAALTGGGSAICPVFYNGTAWVGG